MATKTIAYLTDAHLGQKIILDKETGHMRYEENIEEHKDKLKFILEDIRSAGITEIIFGGDIGTQEANQWFFETIDGFNFKLLMVLGNHDTYSQVNQYYKKYQYYKKNQYYKDDQYYIHPDKYGDENGNKQDAESGNELNYAYEEGNFKFIYLDSSSNAVSTAQLNWLGQELNTDKEILLFIHHPVLEIRTPLDKIGAALKGRDEIKALLSALQKEVLIFCGHYHMADELTAGNIRQYATPACSYQIEKLSEKIEIDTLTFGYRMITINDNHIVTTVKLFEAL
ncbi:hypothetical protein AY601_0989 [Pedobacter cryoconitis]|uniref:Calcineurin-like phosphoesterase domain-containing protein n=1 Tax=Pedobacter cryoconitis TaxID=188932 RepID=A0A127V9E4_9SPHI|nr:metallophosphoesterase [Pedobacter cryoconitis]AMP97924.1 hypothetical protein AY601_0989 [Pedobacter cryoconitis]